MVPSHGFYIVCYCTRVCVRREKAHRKQRGRERRRREYHISAKIDSAGEGWGCWGVAGGGGVSTEAGTLRRLAAGNRWSGERKHDQDVCSYAKRSKGAGRSAEEQRDPCISLLRQLSKGWNLCWDRLPPAVFLKSRL